MALTTQTSNVSVNTLLGHKLPPNVLVCEVSDDPLRFGKVVQWLTNERTPDNRRYVKRVHSMPFDGTEESALAVLAAMKLTD